LSRILLGLFPAGHLGRVAQACARWEARSAAKSAALPAYIVAVITIMRRSSGKYPRCSAVQEQVHIENRFCKLLIWNEFYWWPGTESNLSRFAGRQSPQAKS